MSGNKPTYILKVLFNLLFSFNYCLHLPQQQNEALIALRITNLTAKVLKLVIMGRHTKVNLNVCVSCGSLPKASSIRLLVL